MSALIIAIVKPVSLTAPPWVCRTWALAGSNFPIDQLCVSEAVY